jgi:HNH endonuclease
MKRFWDKVDITAKCWNWTAGVKHNGYGIFHVPWTGKFGRNVQAHRFIFEMCFGPIPEGMCVCHRCDNRRCVNPSHLFLGSPKDNTQDSLHKGRFGRLKSDIVLAIRAATGRDAEIGQRFGVSRTTVYDIKRKLSWKHI